MSIPAEKVAEVLAMPKKDRAFLAHKLIISLDETHDPDAEKEWIEVIQRRSKELHEGKVEARPIEESLKEIEAELNARRRSS